MKAYLVLDLAINDFAGFRDYIAAIPAHIARHDGRSCWPDSADLGRASNRQLSGVQPVVMRGQPFYVEPTSKVQRANVLTGQAAHPHHLL